MRAYNVFRRRDTQCVCCAVPEDRAVPRFLTTKTWAFGGKLAQTSALPVGFDEAAADAGVRFNGFYIFHAFER